MFEFTGIPMIFGTWLAYFVAETDVSISIAITLLVLLLMLTGQVKPF